MKRLPIIRHVRWAFLTWRVHSWARMWGRAGIGLGIPNESDLNHLDLIWKGKA